MTRQRWLSVALAAFLGASAAAQAQDVVPAYSTPKRTSLWNYAPTQANAVVPAVASSDVYVVPPEQEEKPSRVIQVQYQAPGIPETGGEQREMETSQSPDPPLGPTLPEDVKGLQNLFPGLDHCGIRLYGWLDQGYTYASVGPGLLSIEPRENRFGNEYLLNQAALVLEKPLKKEGWDWGFNITYYAGADPSLLQPKGGIDSPPDNPRFSHDFRQLFLSAHLPILSDGGVDVKVGRQTTIIGYLAALAPYRPFYSNTYDWFYSEDGAWTGVLTDWHVSEQLDIYNGITLGANTFYTTRSSDSYCYIGQFHYYLQPEKKTLLCVGLQAGPNAIFAAPGLAGDFDTVLELRIVQNWNKYFTQVIQSHLGWDTNVPGVGTGEWYGLYTLCTFHLNELLDLNFRAEWFDDVQGTRTGIATAYEAVTVGVDYHPYKYMQIRPEVRSDSADERAFGRGGIPRDHNQLTAAVDLLLKF